MEAAAERFVAQHVLAPRIVKQVDDTAAFAGAPPAIDGDSRLQPFELVDVTDAGVRLFFLWGLAGGSTATFAIADPMLWQDEPGDPASEAPRVSAVGLALALLALVVVGASAAKAWRRLAAAPFGEWDAWAIWNLRARSWPNPLRSGVACSRPNSIGNIPTTRCSAGKCGAPGSPCVAPPCFEPPR